MFKRMMTTVLMRLLMLLPLLWTPAAYGMDLQSAVQRALEHNASLQAEQAGLEMAEADMQRANGRLWPRVSVITGVSRTDSPMGVFGSKLLQQRATTADFVPSTLNYPAAYTNYQSRIQVEMPLFRGGALWAGRNRAESSFQAGEALVEAASQKLIFEVVQAYSEVFQARSRLAAAEKSYEAANRLYDNAKALSAKGVVIRSDVMDANVHVLNARVQKVQAEHAVAHTEDVLRHLLGMPAGALALEHQPKLHMPGQNLDALLDWAENNRPDVKAMQAKVEAAESGVTEGRAGFLPQVDVVASQEWNHNRPGLKHGNTSVAGVMSWNVFAGGADKAEWQRAQAGLAKARYRLLDQRQQVRLEVMDAWRNQQEAHYRLLAQEQARTQAEESFRILSLRYEQGLEKTSELLTAQARLDAAEAMAIRARFDTTIAEAAVMLAAGKLSPESLNEQ